MPATQRSKQFQPLCYEHHSQMEVSGWAVTSNGEERPSYACAEPDCPVQYSDCCGYFIVCQSRNPDELDLVPKVKCRQDGVLMYLAEITPEKKDFRLWRCPQCGGIRTNDEDLTSNVPRAKRIFQITYNEELGLKRAELLRSIGYGVVSVLGNEGAKILLNSIQHYDLFIVGHSAPEQTRKEIVDWLRSKYQNVKILALNAPQQPTLQCGLQRRTKRSRELATYRRTAVSGCWLCA